MPLVDTPGPIPPHQEADVHPGVEGMGRSAVTTQGLAEVGHSAGSPQDQLESRHSKDAPQEQARAGCSALFGPSEHRESSKCLCANGEGSGPQGPGPK